MTANNYSTSEVKIKTAIGPVSITPQSPEDLLQKPLNFVRTELRLVSLMSQSLESQDPSHATVTLLRSYESALASFLIQKLYSHA